MYRGLRPEEVDAQYRLIAKGIQTFEDNLSMVSANASGWFDLKDYGPLLSVGNHLWGIPTSGISTSSKFKTAAFYARAGEKRTGVVVRIDRSILGRFDIRELWVDQIFPQTLGGYRAIPDDSEAILVNKFNIFPRDIIDQIFTFNEENQSWTEIPITITSVEGV